MFFIVGQRVLNRKLNVDLFALLFHYFTNKTKRGDLFSKIYVHIMIRYN
jgi:hypothetical protein